MGDTDLAGDEGVEEALPSEVTLARPGRGLNVELEKNSDRIISIYGRPPDKSAYWKTTFFISHPKHVVGTQKNPKHMFKLIGKKIITILRS